MSGFSSWISSSKLCGIKTGGFSSLSSLLKEWLELWQGEIYSGFWEEVFPLVEHLSSSSGQWLHSQPCQSPGNVWVMHPGAQWDFGVSCLRPGVWT